MKNIIYLSLLISVLFLTGCLARKNAWVHYDECSLEYKSFIDVVVCGKARRNNFCGPVNSCSSGGNSIVQYADSLAQSIKSKELSEAQARREWIEFRNGEDKDFRNSINSISQSFSSPVVCNTVSGITTCF